MHADLVRSRRAVGFVVPIHTTLTNHEHIPRRRRPAPPDASRTLCQ